MELRSSTAPEVPRILARRLFSNTVSTLFGLNSAPEKTPGRSRRRLPARYRIALAAEASLFKRSFPDHLIAHCRKPAPRVAIEFSMPVGEIEPDCSVVRSQIVLVIHSRPNLERFGFTNTPEYCAIFGPNGLIQRAKEHLIESRFNPRKMLA